MIRREVAPSDIMQAGDNVPHVVYDPLLKSLPITKDWSIFERICLELLQDEHELRGVKTYLLYGSQGQKQKGLDIVGQCLPTGKKIAAQCKRYKAVSPKNIVDWADKFITESDMDDYQEFILCVSCSVSSDTKLVEAWHKAERELEEKKIIPTLWDYDVIQEKLRKAKRITEKYYGIEAATRFCSNLPVVDSYPYSYRKKKIFSINGLTFIENNTVRLEFSLPTKKKPNIAAAFSFTRTDLNGVTISCDGNSLVRFMQERAHASFISETSLVHVTKTGKPLNILVLPTVRLTLKNEEVTDLDWVIAEGWKRYIEQVKSLEAVWKTARFDLLNKDDFVFKLFKVERWFWSAIIDYTYEFDYANGNSEHHIFDNAPGCLKVYVDNETPILSQGFHLIMYPYFDASVHSTGLFLCWEPLTDIIGEPLYYSSRDAWDAEYTHNWLLDYLLPRVYDWLKEKEQSVRKNRFSFLNLKKKEPNYRELGNFCISYANSASRNIGLRVRNISEALDLAKTLQNHYTVYKSNVAVEVSAIISVLKACQCLIESMPHYENSYIKRKLGLRKDNVLVGITSLINSKDENVFPTPGFMDHSLRALCAILRDKSELKDYEIESLSDFIRPAWERYLEDRVCSSYN